MAARWPPGPEPTTMRSYFSMVCRGSISPLQSRSPQLTRAQRSAMILKILLPAALRSRLRDVTQAHVPARSGGLRLVLAGVLIGLRVSILASGSSGNVTLLETERTRLLVDAGLGKRETLARLAAVERTFDHLDGILITHEHTDHCNGLPQMLGLWKAPLFVTEPTMDALHRTLPDRLAKRLRGVETIYGGQRFTIGDIEIHAFAIPHDAADPVRS